MPFENMFPKASDSLKTLQAKYKKIKGSLLAAEDIEQLNESLGELLKLIEEAHKDAADSWDDIQKNSELKKAARSAGKALAWLVGAESKSSYLPKLRKTINALKAKFTELDKISDETKDKIDSVYDQYIKQVIKPLSNSEQFTNDIVTLVVLQDTARFAFGEYILKELQNSCTEARKIVEEYANHKNKEMENYKKDYADTNFEDSAVYNYWALLQMIFTSSHADHEGKNYMKEFGGGFLGLLFTHVYKTLRGPDN